MRLGFMLLAGLSTVFAFLWLRRLYPGKVAKMPYPGVTDNRFVLVLVEGDAAFDCGAVRALCERHGAVHVEERVETAEFEVREEAA